MFSMFAFSIAALAAKPIEIACWLELPTPDTMAIQCGAAIDGEVVNTVTGPIVPIDPDMSTDDLAHAFCLGTYAVMGAKPPVTHQI